MRGNDDGDNAHALEEFGSTRVSRFPEVQITNIDVPNGCAAGTDPTSLTRSFQVNGTRFQLGNVT